MTDANTTELERIDLCIRLNWWLIADGPHPAVDGKAVRRVIDDLLDKRRTLSEYAPTPGKP